jgi:hypothetical protein
VTSGPNLHASIGIFFYFTLIEVKSIVPNGVTFTSVTRSDQPDAWS